MTKNLLSVIVPTLGDGDDVRAHLARVAEAGAANLELIVVCASQTDLGEEDILRHGFRRAKVVHGRDVSQPDAVNLGAELATGAFLTWLNPGDDIRPNAVTRVLAQSGEHDADIVYGRAQLRNGQNAVSEYPVGPCVSLDTLFQACGISQPAAWISRTAWARLGGVHARFDCAFDYDLWIRAVRSSARFAFVDEIFADVDVSPGSKSFARRADVFREQCELLMHHYGRCPPSALTAMWAEALAPAEGYPSITADLLRQAESGLKSIGQTCAKVGDYHTAQRLRTDARLHFLSQGIAIESGRDGYLSQSGRICISADRLPINLLFQLDRLPDSLDDVAILIQPDLEPARCTLLDSTRCIAARIEANVASVEAGFVALSFLSTADLGARLINAW